MVVPLNPKLEGALLKPQTTISQQKQPPPSLPDISKHTPFDDIYNIQMKLSSWIFLLMLAVGSSCYMIDENNYFYLNTSYNKEVISFTMGFRVEGNVTVRLESEVLVPQGNHITEGLLDQEKGILLDNPYDPEVVGFNNYDFGEYWLGVKVQYTNPQKNDFVELKINLKQGDKVQSYQFLLPLFSYVLSAIEVSPKNSLKVCQGKMLVSSRYAYGEYDVSVFGIKDVSQFQIEEKKNWGYFKEDISAKYLRYKSKFSKTLTLKGQTKNQKLTCKIVQESSSNRPLQPQKSTYKISDLLKSEQAFEQQQQL